MPAKLCTTLGAQHVLTSPLLLYVHLALGALLSQDDHKLHNDIIVVSLVLPLFNQEAGHCVVFLSATIEAKLFSTGTSHHRIPVSLLQNNTKTRKEDLSESAGSLTTF